MTAVKELIEQEAHEAVNQLEQLGYVNPMHSPTVHQRIEAAIHNVLNRMPKDKAEPCDLKS